MTDKYIKLLEAEIDGLKNGVYKPPPEPVKPDAETWKHMGIAEQRNYRNARRRYLYGVRTKLRHPGSIELTQRIDRLEHILKGLKEPEPEPPPLVAEDPPPKQKRKAKAAK